MKRRIRAVLPFTLLLIPAFLMGQERQLPFDTEGRIFEIQRESPYGKIWENPDIGSFDRLLAFEADTGVVIEIYEMADNVPVRRRRAVTRAWFTARQQELDRLVTAVETQGTPQTEQALEDLQSDFTTTQTAYSAFHGLTFATLLESGASFFIFTGGSYFLISAISDQLALTRANVEAASYGHLTGLLQGYMAGMTFFSDADDLDDAETTAKMVLLTTSAGGISHAAVSYSAMSGATVDPTVQYLRMVAERHSLVWGVGLGALAAGERGDSRTVTGLGVLTSLSSNWWSVPLFGLDRRSMSWGDALLADEFMTPWYLTLAAVGTTLEISEARGVGALLLGGGVGGYLLALSVNEGEMRGLGAVRRTRLLTYGGALLGLGIIVATEAGAEAGWWVLSGATWLGYFVGSGSGGGREAGVPEVRLMPEGILLGSLLRPDPGRPQIPSAPVLRLSWSF